MSRNVRTGSTRQGVGTVMDEMLERLKNPPVLSSSDVYEWRRVDGDQSAGEPQWEFQVVDKYAKKLLEKKKF